MTQKVRTLAAGPDWRVSDIICSAGPHDRRFEEAHPGVCIAVVTRGTFQYRTAQGSATLLPGSVLLGDAGACFECGHDHSQGDRCLSFHYQPALFGALPSASRFKFAGLPPLPSLAPLAVAAELAQTSDQPDAIEELALDIADRVTSLLRASERPQSAPSKQDERRVAAAIRHIELHAERKLSLADLASQAAMSRFHFLRTFRHIAGVTPHQFVLRTRLHAAALALARSDRPVLEIALDAGFADLSTFNRRFRQIMGDTPSAFRRRER